MPDPAPSPHSPSDPALLLELAAEDGVETEASADLGRLASEAWGRITDGWDLDGGPPDVVSLLADAVRIGLVVLAGVFVLWLLAMALRRFLGRRLMADPQAGVPTVALAAPIDPDAALHAALAAGDARAALAALWTGLTHRLAEGGLGQAGEDRTCRDFVRSARTARPDWPSHRELRTLARDVERLAYAGPPPSVDAVRALVPIAAALQP